MAEQQHKRRDICIYKPNKKQTGSAAQFKMGGKNDCMFLECASQVKPMGDGNPYDWSSKIVVKLGTTDITKMLAYMGLDAPSAPLRLHHESPSGGDKQISLEYQVYNGRPQYFMSVSARKTKSDKPQKVSFGVSLDEAEFLKVGFRRALEVILNW